MKRAATKNSLYMIENSLEGSREDKLMPSVVGVIEDDSSTGYRVIVGNIACSERLSLHPQNFIQAAKRLRGRKYVLCLHVSLFISLQFL